MRGVQSAGVRWLQAVGAKEGTIGRGEVEKSRSCSDIIQNKTAVKNGRRDGVLRGDDGAAFFRMLSHDMKQLELQRLKRLAMERPPRIRRYSFLLLGCMLLLYMGVMGYQILGTMSGIF